MTTTEFTALRLEEQMDVLYYEADVLANRYEEAFIYLLYHLDDFFIELRYDAHTNELRQVSAFRSTDRLEPYLPYLSELESLLR